MNEYVNNTSIKLRYIASSQKGSDPYKRLT